MFRLRSVLLGLLLMPCVLGAQTALQVPPRLPALPPLLPPVGHPVLDRMRAAHALTCGVSSEEEDYSRGEDHGNRAAFDMDLCKAVAVATLGAGARIVVKSYPDEAAAVRGLRSAEVDLVPTVSLSVLNMAQGLSFSAPVLQDGQGFLYPNNAAVRSPVDLAGKKVCFLTASNAEQGLHHYAETHGIRYVWYPFSEAGEMEAAFFTGNCDAISSDLTQLANIRAIDPRRSSEFSLSSQTVRQDPLAMASWSGDARFAAIVYWTREVLLQAEELGISRSNVGSFRDSDRPEVQQLLGQRYGTGTALGLDPHWGAAVIGAVGNYGEVFERDLGMSSRLRMERGDNRLGSRGGTLAPVSVTSQ